MIKSVCVCLCVPWGKVISLCVCVPPSHQFFIKYQVCSGPPNLSVIVSIVSIDVRLVDGSPFSPSITPHDKEENTLILWD